jgi:peptidoglycan/xylan/chitin deacetylase (PgdA/CDA1 family)
VKYRYFRDPSRTAYPKLDATTLEDFCNQVKELATQFEIASLEASVDFMTGEYRPRRDLCLLTFDGGLKDHLTSALPFLLERRIRGVFFLITSCMEERKVAPGHMNEFLMAAMDLETYAELFRRQVVALRPDAFSKLSVDPVRAVEMFPWDTAEAARFKYLFHCVIDPELRDRSVRELFQTHIGPEEEFAASLYLTWDEARQMQKAGMSMGGHTHQHKPLSTLSTNELMSDLESCRRLLAKNLMPQAVLPFAYPGGDKNSFHVRAVRKLQELGFDCAFCTESGDNRRGADIFTIARTELTTALRVQAGA